MRKVFTKVFLFIILFMLYLILSKTSYASGEVVTFSATGDYNYDYAMKVVKLVNEKRSSLGLSTLKVDRELMDAAMLRSAETSFYFSHTRPSGESCFSVSRKSYGENIALNSTPESVMDAWVKSSGHYANIVKSGYKSIGVGCYKVGNSYYYTQIFGYAEPSNSSTTGYTGSKSANVKVTMKDEYIQDLNCNISSSTKIEAGKTTTLNIRFKSADILASQLSPTNYSVTVGNSSILSYKNGVLTAVKAGSTKVTIKIGSHSKTYDVLVTSNTQSIAFSNPNLSITEGQKVKLNVVYNPTDANLNTELTWSSYNTNIAEVDSNGYVYAKKAGKTTIKAVTKNYKYAYCTLTVKEALPFPDVKISDWYYPYVEYVYNEGIMTGYTAGQYKGYFGANDNITRAQVVTILYRSNGSKAVSYDTEFSDIKDKSLYYYDAVKWAAKNGIVTGYKSGINAGKFLPDNPITREELAIILYRYAGYKKLSTTYSNNVLTQFGDYKEVSDWAEVAVKWAVSKGIISGNTNTAIPTIKPQGHATRAEAATMINRFCEKLAK